MDPPLRRERGEVRARGREERGVESARERWRKRHDSQAVDTTSDVLLFFLFLSLSLSRWQVRRDSLTTCSGYAGRSVATETD